MESKTVNLKANKIFKFITLVTVFVCLGLLLITFQFKTVTLNYYGNTKDVKTLATTVSCFLTENNIYIDDEVIVSPSLNSKLDNNTVISIGTRKDNKKIETSKILEEFKPSLIKFHEEIEILNFAEEKVDNPIITRGVTRVQEAGVNGEKTVKYFVKYEDNKEVLKVKLNEMVTVKPKTQIVELGTKLTPTSARYRPVISNVVDYGFKSYNIKLSIENQQIAYNLCKYYNIPYELFLALMYKESGYNQNAISATNDYGMCQINISNHNNLINKLGITNFLDPKENMIAGAYMLSLYLTNARKITGDENTAYIYALNSYNMGEGSYYKYHYAKGNLNRTYSTNILSAMNKLLQNNAF